MTVYTAKNPTGCRPMTRAFLARLAAQGVRVCVSGPGGALTAGHEVGFAAALVVAVSASVGGGPWREVSE